MPAIACRCPDRTGVATARSDGRLEWDREFVMASATHAADVCTLPPAASDGATSPR